MLMLYSTKRGTPQIKVNRKRNPSIIYPMSFRKSMETRHINRSTIGAAFILTNQSAVLMHSEEL